MVPHEYLNDFNGDEIIFFSEFLSLGFGRFKQKPKITPAYYYATQCNTERRCTHSQKEHSDAFCPFFVRSDVVGLF